MEKPTKEEDLSFLNVKERLGAGEWLWQKNVVEEIRKSTVDRRVVVFDLDGVLRSNLATEEIHPEAENVLTWLKDQGFYVVIWTSATRETLSDEAIIPIVDMADLSITRENYRVNQSNKGVENRDEGEMEEWKNSVDTATWIDAEQRQRIDAKGRGMKQPELLFKNVVLVEDGGIYEQCFDFEWEDDYLFAILTSGDDSLFSHICVETWNADEEIGREKAKLDDDYVDRRLSVDLIKRYLVKMGWISEA